MINFVLGIIMFYFWIHAIVIIFKNIKVKGYNKAVLIIAFIFLILLFLGLLFGK